MGNLTKKLKEIESRINQERSKKTILTKKVEQREKKIHLNHIKEWNSGILNNKTFINSLNTIQKRFRKINPKNNRYSWMFYAADISSKEKVKDQVAFYVNSQKVYMQLCLEGIYSRVELYSGDEYKIDKLKKAKEEFLNIILKVFEDQNH